MTPLSSKHPFVKTIAGLHRRKNRDAERLTLAEGIHPALDALAALSVEKPPHPNGDAQSGDDALPPAFGVTAVLAAESAARHPEWPRVAEAAERAGVPLRWLADAAYARMSELSAPEGVAVVLRFDASVDARRLAALWNAPDARLLVAAGVQDPGNAGALVRVAEAAGAGGAVFAGGVDPRHPKFLRAAMGSAFRLSCVGCAVDELLALWRGRADMRRYYAGARGNLSMDRADWRPPMALLMGGEGGGAPACFHEGAREVAIPMSGGAESLNVAVAAGVLLYAARKAWEPAIGEAHESK